MPERAALIVERPTCLECLTLKSGLTLVQLEQTLTAIRAALQLHEERGRCRA
jgi:hypothetical protein